MNWGPDHWSALANVVIAGAAWAAAFAAFRGLNTWKSQIIWNADNGLARKLLIAVYRYRDSLYSVRHLTFNNAEMALDPADAEGLSNDQRNWAGTIVAYERRWERHLPTQNELDALLLEADAVRGKELSGKFQPLKELQQELFVNIELFRMAHSERDPNLVPGYKETLRKKRNIFYDTMNDKDIFRKDFVARLEPVESYLRCKLGRTR